MQGIEPGQLFYESHREIYDVMLAITRRGELIDPVTISDELRARHKADAVGGQAYIASLLDGCVRADTLKPYITRIRGHYFDRELLRVSKEIGYIAVNRKGGSITESIRSARASLDTLVAEHETGGLIAASEVVDLTNHQMEQPVEKVRAKWGFPDLDRITKGIHKGNFTVVAARTSVGKSAFITTVLRNLARAGTPTCLFTMEMEAEEVQKRLISMETRIPLHCLMDGQEGLNKDEIQRYVVQTERMRAWPYWIDASASLTISDIRAKITRLQQLHEIKVILVDYLQLLRPEGRFSSRREAVDELARGLKGLAGELGVSLVGLAQLNRAMETRTDHRPTLADLRESGEIEQSANNVVFLYRPGYYDEAINRNLTEVIVAKQRNGPIDKLELMFIPEFTTFENMDWRAR